MSLDAQIMLSICFLGKTVFVAVQASFCRIVIGIKIKRLFVQLIMTNLLVNSLVACKDFPFVLSSTALNLFLIDLGSF